MRFFCVAAALATASAFTTSPAAFTTISPSVGERSVNNVFADNSAHRTRKATIVMDGKANGEFPSIFESYGFYIRTSTSDMVLQVDIRTTRIQEKSST